MYQLVNIIRAQYKPILPIILPHVELFGACMYTYKDLGFFLSANTHQSKLNQTISFSRVGPYFRIRFWDDDVQYISSFEITVFLIRVYRLLISIYIFLHNTLPIHCQYENRIVFIYVKRWFNSLDSLGGRLTSHYGHYMLLGETFMSRCSRWCVGWFAALVANTTPQAGLKNQL